MKKQTDIDFDLLNEHIKAIVRKRGGKRVAKWLEDNANELTGVDLIEWENTSMQEQMQAIGH